MNDAEYDAECTHDGDRRCGACPHRPPRVDPFTTARPVSAELTAFMGVPHDTPVSIRNATTFVLQYASEHGLRTNGMITPDAALGALLGTPHDVSVFALQRHLRRHWESRVVDPFTTARPVSAELTAFMGVPRNTPVSIRNATMFVLQYVSEHGLRANGMITPDPALGALLGTPHDVSVLALQGYMRRHWHAPAPDPVALPVVVPLRT
jgi:chromatin remodeling complex protein RSC6